MQPGRFIPPNHVALFAIGEGAQAVVWCVQDATDGALLALKVLTSRHPDAVLRLQQEAAALRRIQHPNVVSLVDVLSVDGAPALLMEWVEGPSLADVLAAQAPTVAQADAVAAGLLAGLSAAHRAGVVHRDIKPANIVLQQRGGNVRPCLIDFGVARGQPVETQAGRLLGTPRYMAPEQLRDARSVDARADIWAAGCVLYELACQRPAFSGEIVAARDGAAALAALPAGLPARWRDAIRAALVERVDTAEAVAVRWGAAPGPAVWDGVLSGARPAPCRLPPEQDTFVGRQEDVAQIAGLIQRARLVSLLGTGGIGKTRLARRVGWESVRAFPGGVWFCDLSEARTAEDICQVVAGALEAPLQGDPVAQLAAIFGRRKAGLLILDNFEQLVEEGRLLLSRWLGAAPTLRILVTSRARIGLPEEVPRPVEPMPLDTDAATLFVIRARRKKPGFHLTDANRDTVHAIVSMLDGLPLAIELAAARAQLLSPERIRQRLQQRFRLLAGPRRRGRQATMRAAIDWSWQLLEPAEQAVMAQLSVFEGGFTLEAAQAVVGVGRDVIASLADRSLLRRIAPDRWGMFLSIRAYAAEQLQGRGDGADVECKHYA